jgi:hypothetical protein
MRGINPRLIRCMSMTASTATKRNLEDSEEMVGYCRGNVL